MRRNVASPTWLSAPPKSFDIVTCWFPDDTKDELRPCLVIDTRRGEDGALAFRVALGTSNNLKIDERGDIDLIITDPVKAHLLGLERPTRFDLECVAILPWTPDFFDCWRDKQSPIIGRLNEDQSRDFAFKMYEIDQRGH